MLPEAMRTCVILSGSGAPAGWSSDCVMSRAGWSSIAGTSAAPASGAGSVMSTMFSVTSIHTQSDVQRYISSPEPDTVASTRYSPLSVTAAGHSKLSVCTGPISVLPTGNRVLS